MELATSTLEKWSVVLLDKLKKLSPSNVWKFIKECSYDLHGEYCVSDAICCSKYYLKCNKNQIKSPGLLQKADHISVQFKKFNPWLNHMLVVEVDGDTVCALTPCLSIEDPKPHLLYESDTIALSDVVTDYVDGNPQTKYELNVEEIHFQFSEVQALYRHDHDPMDVLPPGDSIEKGRIFLGNHSWDRKYFTSEHFVEFCKSKTDTTHGLQRQLAGPGEALALEVAKSVLSLTIKAFFNVPKLLSYIGQYGIQLFNLIMKQASKLGLSLPGYTVKTPQDIAQIIARPVMQKFLTSLKWLGIIGQTLGIAVDILLMVLDIYLKYRKERNLHSREFRRFVTVRATEAVVGVVCSLIALGIGIPLIPIPVVGGLLSFVIGFGGSLLLGKLFKWVAGKIFDKLYQDSETLAITSS